MISQACFVPNLTGYDVLIHLNASTNLRRYQQVNRDQNFIVKLEEFDESITKCMPVVGFDPIELYLKELRVKHRRIKIPQSFLKRVFSRRILENMHYSFAISMVES